MLVPHCHHNKVPHTGWLKTMETCYLTALDARSLQSRCGQGHIPPEGSKWWSFLAPSASGSCWQCLAIIDLSQHKSNLCFCCHMDVFLCICVQISFLFKDNGRWTSAHPDPVWPHLNKLDLQGPCFQIRSYSQTLGIRTRNVFWGRHYSTQDINHMLKSQKPSSQLTPFEQLFIW